MTEVQLERQPVMAQSGRKHPMAGKRRRVAKKTARVDALDLDVFENANAFLAMHTKTAEISISAILLISMAPFTVTKSGGVQCNFPDVNHKSPNQGKILEIMNNFLGHPMGVKTNHGRRLGNDGKLFAVNWNKARQNNRHTNFESLGE